MFNCGRQRYLLQMIAYRNACCKCGNARDYEKLVFFYHLSSNLNYNFSSEYATFSKCVYAGGLYIFTQLCKMLLLATFFPDSDGSHTSGDYDVFLVSIDFRYKIYLYMYMYIIGSPFC